MQILAGTVAIIVGVFYLKMLADRKTFRLLALLGSMVVASGVATSEVVGLWPGIVIFLSWFVLATYVWFKERKERRT